MSAEPYLTDRSRRLVDALAEELAGQPWEVITARCNAIMGGVEGASEVLGEEEAQARVVVAITALLERLDDGRPVSHPMQAALYRHTLNERLVAAGEAYKARENGQVH